MFEFVRAHKRVMQFVLVLLIFPSFVFFGIQGYTRFTESGNQAVATVDGLAITQAEWDAAHRNQVERARRQLPQLDAKLFDAPEVKRETLDALIRERVMFAAARRLHLMTTDERLQHLFVSDPQYAGLRNPDGSVNKNLLAAQGLSSEQFAQQLRQELTLRQVVLGLAGSSFAPPAVAASALDAYFQQREVQVQRFNAKDYLGKVEPTDAQIETFYQDPGNKALLTAPETASIEYVVLDLEAVSKDIRVSEEDLRKYYQENAARYTSPEERRASHILVKADKSAPAAERQQARAKAQSLLDEVRKAPATFGDLAKKNSDDPGSASKGGDLDFFGRGAMVKPFEDAVFALKPGEISDVVETDFGYHVIRLDEMRGGQKKPFEAVRAEVEDEVRRQLAQRKYAEVAEQFSNLVYEQPDSLAPVVEKLKLDLRKGQVQRQSAPSASGVLASPKFLEALFSADSLANKRNTDAVETGPNQMVSGRIVSYTPAQLRPLAEVRTLVRNRLASQQAAAMAREEGQRRLAEAKAGAELTMPAAQAVSRARSADLPPSLVEAVLRADASSLPAWLGVPTGADGFAVVRLNKVLGRDPAAGDAKLAQAQYGQAWAAAETQAYYAALQSRFKVEVTVRAAASPAPSQ